MVSHKNHNLSANEGFVIFLTSKLTTCFVDGVTLKMKSPSIAYQFLNGGESIYWVLDFEDDGLYGQATFKNAKGNFIYRVEWAGSMGFIWVVKGGAQPCADVI